MQYYLVVLFTTNEIFLHNIGPIKSLFSQYCGYWWPGASAPGHLQPQCWELIHACIALYRLSGFSNFNTLRPRRNRRHFADDTFKCIFVNENVWILFKISLTFVPKVQINNIPSLVQIMAWRRPGAKTLSEPMMVSLLTHTCVTRPQWVNRIAI